MDERQRLREAGFTEAEIDAYLGVSKSEAPVPKSTAVGRQVPVTRKLPAAIVGAASGMPGAEVLAGITSAMLGGTYRGGRESIAQAQRESRDVLGPVKYGASEIAGTLAIGTPALRGATTAMGRAMRFAGMGGVRGASRAGIGQEETSAADVLGGAARQAAGEFAGSLVGEKVAGPLIGRVAQKTGVSAIAGEVGRRLDVGRRGVADALMSPSVQSRLGPRTGQIVRSAAQAIEPSDISRLQRIYREELKPTGETVEEVVNPLLRQARAITARPVAPVVNQAREAARRALDAAKAEAGTAVPGVGVTGADALRTSIRRQQVQAGDKSYQLVRDLGAEPDVNLVAESVLTASRSPLLRAAYRAAVNRSDANLQRVVIGTGKRQKELLIPDLEGLDLMRQSVRKAQAAGLSGDKTGFTRSQAREAMREIDALEKQYLDALPEEAGTALKAARAEYHEYFEQLRALQAGLNLGNFGVGRQAGLLSGSARDLAALERRLVDEELTSPAAREAFKIGAAEWVNTVIQRSPDDAAKVAKAFVGTEEARRRARLALGDEAVTRMQSALERVQSAGRAVTEASSSARNIGRVGQTEVQRVQELARQLRAGVGAVTGAGPQAVERAAGFARGIAPEMSPFARQQTRNVAASALDRQLAGKTPEQAMEYLDGLRRNPTARLLFGEGIESAIRRIQARTEMLPAIPATAGAVFGGRYTGGRD